MRMRNWLRSLIAVAVFGFVFMPMAWSQYGGGQAAMDKGKLNPLVPTPRTADKHPDLSGTWSNLGLAGASSPDDAILDTTDPNYSANIEKRTYDQRYGPPERSEMKMTEWEQRIYAYNQDTRNPDGASPIVNPGNPNVYKESGLGAREELDPWFDCVPLGAARLALTGGLDWTGFEIIQTPVKVVMIYESDHTVREIYTDGRGHFEHAPTHHDAIYTYRGDSVGHWEGDTLVVETINMRNDQWMDSNGHIASPELKMIERFERPEKDILKHTITLIDPIALKEPYTTVKAYGLRDWNIQEMVRCRFGDEKWLQQQELFNQSILSSQTNTE
jgi:hypothetical protein